MSIENDNSENESGGIGAGIFWPGYVDAISNLVLNLLFLVTIMTVAVFMFSIELGRSTMEKALDAHKMEELENAASAEKESAAQALKKGIPERIVPATLVFPKPKKGLLAVEGEVTVRFTDEAVKLTEAERIQLREALKPIVAGGGALIYLEVPTGFSEAKRMGFYRAMEVRNVLIEMKMPQKLIDVEVREGKITANASLVRVIPK